MEKTLKELMKEQLELQSKLEENRSKQKVILTKEFIDKHGIDIGYDVSWIDGNKGYVGQITSIEYSGVVPNRFIATLCNSDGKIGKRTSRIWGNSMKTLKVISKTQN